MEHTHLVIGDQPGNLLRGLSNNNTKVIEDKLASKPLAADCTKHVPMKKKKRKNIYDLPQDIRLNKKTLNKKLKSRAKKKRAKKNKR